jgi:tRNA nucleotidyltransferase (CCA-adding enzyme)
MRPVDLLERLGRPPAVAALDGEEAVYVVGGAVRDLLLSRLPHELDFVVEGDAAAVARRTGGRVIAHERFGTATVILQGGATFDLTSARRERYERPGALPEVELGASLREDLERRDFTVNAIALRLADGALTDWPGAREDLAAGVLRVLHERSFEDDPTRLLRMARYGARLGFEPDRETDALAASATVDTVSGGRLGSELRLLLREPQPASLCALERFALGRAVVHPSFRADAGLIERVRALCPPDARADLAALASTLTGADASSLRGALDRLEFDAGSRGTVLGAAGAAALAAELRAAGDDAALWQAARRAGPEVVAVAGALGAEEAARRWLGDVRHRRLAITGDDFVAAGLTGPAVGEALEAAQLAALAGAAPGAAEQLAAGLAAVRPS